MTDPEVEGSAAAEREAWDSVAPAWSKWWRTFEDGAQGLNERLVALAEVAAGDRVLDLASGIGEPALTAARAAGPQGAVLANDLSGEMLAFARTRAAAAGLDNIRFVAADAERLDAGDAAFDAAVCRWGLMLMADPVAAARRAHAALRPGARFAAAVWGRPEVVPLLAVASQVIAREFDLPAPDPAAPGPFRLQDDSALADVLTAAGFRDVTSERHTVTMTFASPSTYAQFVTEMSSSARKAFATMPASRRQAAIEAIAAAVADRAGDPGDPDRGGRIVLANESICAAGAK